MSDRALGLRILALSCGFVLVFSIISWRLVYLQLTCHQRRSSEVESQHVKLEALPARRGSLVDRNGELLASDKPVRDVVVDCKHLNHLPFVLRVVAELESLTEREVTEKYSEQQLRKIYLGHVAEVLGVPLGLPKQEVLAKLSYKRGAVMRPKLKGEVVLARGLEEEVGEQFQQNLYSRFVRGVECRKAMSRHYATERLGHVIGFIDHAHVGAEGVERALNSLLMGKDGYREVSRDRNGDEILAFRGDVAEPRHGLLSAIDDRYAHSGNHRAGIGCRLCQSESGKKRWRWLSVRRRVKS